MKKRYGRQQYCGIMKFNYSYAIFVLLTLLLTIIAQTQLKLKSNSSEIYCGVKSNQKLHKKE